MTATADEGMWLLTDPPRATLKAKYQFDLTDDWLKKAQLGSIRFNNGGSGSFVSPHGLIITNHHIGSDALQKLSTPQRNLIQDGYLAKTPAEELPCPDLELNVLQEVVDVTERVNAAVPGTLAPAAASAQRRAILSSIEKESLEQTGHRSDVVTLYQGGLYHLYRYRKFTDVRLVFAPESAIAFFGGDTDNFEFPRYNLDVCFFRAYVDGKPYEPPSYFRMNPDGVAEGDLVFVTGHPGSTNRLETLDKLKHRRDVTLPYQLEKLRCFEAFLLQYAETGPEAKLASATDLHRVANARKALSGQHLGLLNPAILATKHREQLDLLTRLRDKSETTLLNEAKAALQKVAEIQTEYAKFERELSLLERGDAFYCEYFNLARTIVRLIQETPKPNSERLREYRDSNLESLKQNLYSPAPIDRPLERLKLLGSLRFLAEQMGADHPLVTGVYGGRSPAEVVDTFMTGTLLDSPAEREKLVAGGPKALDDCRDPMIQFARAVDAEARKLRRRYEDSIEEPERQAYGTLAQARFAVFGRAIAPDATFTLRLAFGVVKGYDAEGEKIPFCTTFGGAFAKAAKLKNREPFTLPQRWLERQSKLDAATPFDFVSTADTIGGNSGSPVLNRAGEFVGINFDRNRFGLVRNFVYTDVQARHIAVDVRAIVAALKQVYDAEKLVQELLP